jgi:hypothetical protein
MECSTFGFHEEGSHGRKSKFNFKRKELGWRVRCNPPKGKRHLMTHISFAKNPDTGRMSVSSNFFWTNEELGREIQGTNVLQE